MAIKGSRERGRPSINQARVDRRRALVAGRVRIQGGDSRFWVWTVVIFLAFGVVYWRFAEGQLRDSKSELMARQRAVAVGLNPKLEPYRDATEKFVLSLGRPWMEDLVAPGASLDVLQSGPALYLRVRADAATSVKTLRKAAHYSLKDGFSACFFVGRENAQATAGPKCERPADCAPGLLCNQWSVCAEPSDPFNFRLVYRTMRLLSPEWTDAVHTAPNELAVRAMARDVEKIIKGDVPLTVAVLKKAKFLIVVLDEEPQSGLLEGLGDPDAGVPDESEQERLHRTPHTARIGIWEIATGEQLVRMRARADGRFVPVGERTKMDPVSVAARQRQANSCAIATSVRDRLRRPAVTADPVPVAEQTPSAP